jgi:hypothetical protein
MRALVDGLPSSTLSIVEGSDHSLMTTRKAGAKSVEDAVAGAVAWMRARVS